MDDVNLLPGAFLIRRQRRKRLQGWITVLAVTLVVLPVGAFALHRHLSAAEDRLRYLTRQREQLGERISQLETLYQHQQRLHLRAGIVNSLLSRTPLQALFFDLAALTDDAIWLTHVRLERAPQSPSTNVKPAPPSAPRPNAFFTLGQRPGADRTAAEQTPDRRFSLSLRGYTTSTQRLADFMSGLSQIPYLSKVKLQVAQRGLFEAYEAIEFVIGIQL